MRKDVAAGKMTDESAMARYYDVRGTREPGLQNHAGTHT